jgi:hypothetical protein
MQITEQKRRRILERGPMYCFWRYGLLGFGLPIAVLASLAQEVLRRPSFSLSSFLPDLLFSVLIGAPVAGGLYSIDLWRRVSREDEA